MARPLKARNGEGWVAPVRDPITFRRTTVTVGSEKEAKKRIRQSEEAYELARQGSKPQAVSTCSKSYHEWLKDKHGAKTKRAARVVSVCRFAEIYIRTAIDPYFDGISIRDVTIMDLHKFAAYMIDPTGGDLSLRVAKQVVSILKRIFTHAKLGGIITYNPFDEYRRTETLAFLASHRPERPVPMSLKQVRLLLEGAQGMDRLIVFVMLLAGLRSGELAALRWRHVDFVLGGIWVFENGYNFLQTDETGIMDAGPTKTPAGSRFVPWGPKLGEVMGQASEARVRRSGNAYVILSSRGTPFGYEGLTGRLRAIQNAVAGRPRRELRPRGADNVNNHNFRHTAAALWITAGVSFDYIARWMGHAHRMTTISAYGHFLVDPDVPPF